MTKLYNLNCRQIVMTSLMMLWSVSTVLGQERTVSGTVVGTDGTGLPGVSIINENTSKAQLLMLKVPTNWFYPHPMWF